MGSGLNLLRVGGTNVWGMLFDTALHLPRQSVGRRGRVLQRLCGRRMTFETVSLHGGLMFGDPF